MIELTEQQIQAVETANGDPPRVVNPRTNETFVLIRADEYERLTEDEIDYSPWTSEECLGLAWETGKSLGWRTWTNTMIILSRREPWRCCLSPVSAHVRTAWEEAACGSRTGCGWRCNSNSSPAIQAFP